jgi:hypothetical protein
MSVITTMGAKRISAGFSADQKALGERDLSLTTNGYTLAERRDEEIVAEIHAIIAQKEKGHRINDAELRPALSLQGFHRRLSRTMYSKSAQAKKQDFSRTHARIFGNLKN